MVDPTTEQVKAFIRAGCYKSALAVALVSHLTKVRLLGIGVAAGGLATVGAIVRAKLGV